MRADGFLKNVVLAGVAAAALATATIPAQADNIVTNQWYTVYFTATPSPLQGVTPYALGTNPNAVAAPQSPWVITLSSPATFIITDVEDSGDQFQIFDNSVLIGTTSTPVPNASYCGENITACLSNPDFSHGYFTLPAGLNSITGEFIGSVGYGDADFEVKSAVPEPVTLALMGSGLAGAAAMARRRKKKNA